MQNIALLRILLIIIRRERMKLKIYYICIIAIIFNIQVIYSFNLINIDYIFEKYNKNVIISIVNNENYREDYIELLSQHITLEHPILHDINKTSNRLLKKVFLEYIKSKEAIDIPELYDYISIWCANNELYNSLFDIYNLDTELFVEFVSNQNQSKYLMSKRLLKNNSHALYTSQYLDVYHEYLAFISLKSNKEQIILLDKYLKWIKNNGLNRK